MGARGQIPHEHSGVIEMPAYQPIPFRTKRFGLRGVIKTQKQMNTALSGAVDWLYEDLTITVQANGDMEKWAKCRGHEDPLYSLISYVQDRALILRLWISADSCFAIAKQIERDCTY